MQSRSKSALALQESLDDGWGVPEEKTGRLIRSVPHTVTASAPCADQSPGSSLEGGWTLAEGTEQCEVPVAVASAPRMPLAFSPAPLESVLAPEQQEEFSKPFLALGTDLNLPPPSAPWFAELSPVVAKRQPRPATLSPTTASRKAVNIRSCLKQNQEAFELEDTLEQECQAIKEPEAAAPAKKTRWWRRSKR